MINKVKTNFQIFFYLVNFVFFKLYNKKNIFVFPFYHTGGAEKVHLDIVKSFPKKDNLVIFTNKSYNDHFLLEFEKHSNVFHYHKFMRNLYFRMVVLKLLSFIKNSPNITVFGCNSSYFYAILDHLPTKVKKMDLLHAFSLPDPGGAEIQSLGKIHFLDKRVVINNKTKNDFINLYKENNIPIEYLERIKIIDIAVETPSEKPIKEFEKDKLNVIYCGRIAKEKRVNLVIEIAKQVSEIADVKIYGHKEIIIEGIDQFYQKNIIKPQELKQIYEKADILLITSYREGFPVVIKEAMANGVVCISTDVGSVFEHVINHETGYIISSTNEDKIIKEIIDLIKKLSLNKEVLSQISANAYKHAINNFNLNLFNENIRKIVKN